MNAVTHAPAARMAMDRFHADVVDQVRAAVGEHDIVVVGMAWNPHVPKARKALDQAGLQHTYLEFGNYLSGWKPRLALKIWAGWPTFPMVFVKGALVGGNSDVRAALADGSLQAMLDVAEAAEAAETTPETV